MQMPMQIYDSNHMLFECYRHTRVRARWSSLFYIQSYSWMPQCFPIFNHAAMLSTDPIFLSIRKKLPCVPTRDCFFYLVQSISILRG